MGNTLVKLYTLQMNWCSNEKKHSKVSSKYERIALLSINPVTVSTIDLTTKVIFLLSETKGIKWFKKIVFVNLQEWCSGHISLKVKLPLLLVDEDSLYVILLIWPLPAWLHFPCSVAE